MTPHPTIPAWSIPWTEEPGGLWSIGLQRVRHDRGNSAHVTPGVKDACPRAERAACAPRGPRSPQALTPLSPWPTHPKDTVGLARPRPRVGRHSQQPPRKPKPREDRTNAHPPLSEAATFCTQPAASRSPEQQQRPPEQLRDRAPGGISRVSGRQHAAAKGAAKPRTSTDASSGAPLLPLGGKTSMRVRDDLSFLLEWRRVGGAV